MQDSSSLSAIATMATCSIDKPKEMNTSQDKLSVLEKFCQLRQQPSYSDLQHWQTFKAKNNPSRKTE